MTRTVLLRLAPLVVLLMAVALPADAVAQGQARGGGLESRGSGAPPMRPTTPFEDFVDVLRLDLRAQVPETQRLMVEGTTKATPLIQELFTIRQQLLNLELNNQGSEKGPALKAYADGAARMAAAEAATYSEVYALLRPNQRSRAAGGFTQMAGFFFPEANPGRAGRGASGAALGRLDILTNLLTLTGDQKRDVRTVLDAAHKAQADTRKGLVDTRLALFKAIESGADQAAIDAAAAAYATHVTAMTDAEMTAFALIVGKLTPEQRGNQMALATSFALMRGFFVDNRRWDTVPDGRTY